jgi:acetoacetyl-CoA synthetase
VTFFGAGAAFFANCLKAGVDLPTVRRPVAGARAGHHRLAAVARGAAVGHGAVRGASQRPKPRDDIWWCNISGGTDFAGAFIGGHRELPQVPGEMQCRLLGCAVEAWNEQGQPVVDEVGELVCTQPIPSMPLYFGATRQRALPVQLLRHVPAGHGRKPGRRRPASRGRWRLAPRRLAAQVNPATGGTGCIIYGRSDATINRHGLRMGTSELYSAVEALPEVLDSHGGGPGIPGPRELHAAVRGAARGQALDDAMRARINGAIRTALSPRFVPNEIFQVAEIPRTLSGKKQELPIKKLLLGQPLEKVVNREAMANPGCLDWYVELARERERARP